MVYTIAVGSIGRHWSLQGTITPHLFSLPPHITDFFCLLDIHCFVSMKHWFTTHFHGHTTAYKVHTSTFVERFGVGYNAALAPRYLKNGFHKFRIVATMLVQCGPASGRFSYSCWLKAHAEEEQEATIREEL